MTAVKTYQEGDWFAVPLPGGGYGLGLVVRASPTGVLVGYFFGPRLLELPRIEDVDGLTPGQAALVRKFGDLGLRQGKWPIIGRSGRWERSDWPMPAFVRREEFTGRVFKVYYDERDPNRFVGEEEVSPEHASDMNPDGLMGAGFAERLLARTLS